MVFPFFASFVSPKALVWIATAFSRNYNRSGRSTEKLIITGIVLILYINNFFNFRLLTWVGREWNSFVAAEERRFRGVCFSSSLSILDIVAFVFVSRGPIRSRSRFFFLSSGVLFRAASIRGFLRRRFLDEIKVLSLVKCAVSNRSVRFLPFVDIVRIFRRLNRDRRFHIAFLSLPLSLPNHPDFATITDSLGFVLRFHFQPLDKHRKASSWSGL